MRALRVWALTTVLPLLMMVPTLAHSQSLSAAWDANPPSDAITSYEICIGTTSLSCNFQLATVAASETSYTFAPTPGVLYRIAVRAINAVGPGPYSSEVLTSIPGLTQPANQTSPVNVAISPLSLSASDPDGGTIQFTHSGLPFGLSLNQNTGIVTGTPTSPGTFNVTVFVSDGGITTSRSFVWTVNTGGGGDTTAPALAITSHTAGQTVSVSSITLAGTASDNGSGDSGVTSVTVNGTAATGGAVTGSNTANWNRAVTLAAGANTFTIAATDGAGNVRTSSITINRTGADATAPTVSITSHSSGQTVSSATITLTGTATDNGAGGSGIAGVSVNGTPTGATASASNTANWSRTITLAAGANVVTVVATDGAFNARTTPITITYASAAVTNPTMTASLASPQLAGTTVTFTAGASGGTAPYSYKWWILSGGAWTLARDWSTSPTFSWTPSATGSYSIGIWVRGANTTADTNAVNFSIPYVITAPPAVVATGISADLASPRTPGTTVTFTAGATGGTAPYSYKWWVYSGNAWTVVRDYSTSPTFSWTPAAAGNYRIGIWVRSANTTTDSSAGSVEIPYVVTSGPPLVATGISADLASPRTPGTTVTFTAGATGGTAPYSYKWWVYSGSAWTLARDWSTSPTFSWTPAAAGSYQIGIWVRSATTTADSNAVNFSIPYVVTGGTAAPPTPPPTPTTPITVTAIAADQASPRTVGTTVTFTPIASGGTAPYSYKWWVLANGSWTLARDWSTSPTFSWTPSAPGSYFIGIWVRGANTTANTSAVNFSVPYAISGGTGSALTMVNITTDVPSPAAVGQTVAARAWATGGTAPYQFRWWMFNGATWVMVRDWGGDTLTFTPALANVHPNFRLGVWARSAGSTDNTGSVNFSIPFPIVP